MRIHYNTFVYNIVAQRLDCIYTEKMNDNIACPDGRLAWPCATRWFLCLLIAYAFSLCEARGECETSWIVRRCRGVNVLDNHSGGAKASSWLGVGCTMLSDFSFMNHARTYKCSYLYTMGSTNKPLDTALFTLVLCYKYTNNEVREVETGSNIAAAGQGQYHNRNHRWTHGTEDGTWQAESACAMFMWQSCTCQLWVYSVCAVSSRRCSWSVLEAVKRPPNIYSCPLVHIY